MHEAKKPFTPESLAAHWDCTPRHIRNLVDHEKIPSFRVGKLIRIPAAFVNAKDRGEEWKAPSLKDTETPTAQSGGPTARPDVLPFVPRT